MRSTPRHARAVSPRAVRSRRPAPNTNRPMNMPLRRAARAAYTRADTSVPFEQRPPARQRYWTQAVLRALDTALEPGELAEVITTHSQYAYDPESALFRCTCGGYLTTGWANHISASIRAHILGLDQPSSTGEGTEQISTSAQPESRHGAFDRADH